MKLYRIVYLQNGFWAVFKGNNGNGLYFKRSTAQGIATSYMNQRWYPWDAYQIEEAEVQWQPSL